MKLINYKVSDLNGVQKKFDSKISKKCISFKDSTLTIQIDDIVLVEYDMKTKLEFDFRKNSLRNERVLFNSILENVQETKFDLDDSHFTALLSLIFLENRNEIMEVYEFFQKH